MNIPRLCVVCNILTDCSASKRQYCAPRPIDRCDEHNNSCNDAVRIID